MNVLMRSEIKTGAFVKKAIVFIAWIYSMVMIAITLFGIVGNGSGRADSDSRSRLMVGIGMLVVTSLLMVTYFRRYHCVPYWNKVFSGRKLKEMLQDEVFEPVMDADRLYAENVLESQNWISISGYLYPKFLTACVEGYDPKPRVAYRNLRAHYINGEAKLTAIGGNVWYRENELEIIRKLGFKPKGDYINEYGERYKDNFKAAYQRVLANRNLNSLSVKELNLIKAAWIRELSVMKEK